MSVKKKLSKPPGSSIINEAWCQKSGRKRGRCSARRSVIARTVAEAASVSTHGVHCSMFVLLFAKVFGNGWHVGFLALRHGFCDHIASVLGRLRRHCKDCGGSGVYVMPRGLMSTSVMGIIVFGVGIEPQAQRKHCLHNPR